MDGSGVGEFPGGLVMGRKKRKRGKKAGVPRDAAQAKRPKKRVSAKEKALGVLMILISLGATGAILYEPIRDSQIRSEWTKVTARVELRRSWTVETRGAPGKVEMVDIAYDMNGRTMRRQIKGNADGETIDVYVPPPGAGKVIAAERVEGWDFAWFLILTGALFLVGVGFVKDGKE